MEIIYAALLAGGTLQDTLKFPTAFLLASVSKLQGSG